MGIRIRTTSTDAQLVNNAKLKSVGSSGATNGTIARSNDDGNLKERVRLFGNSANHFVAGTPQSDDGADPYCL